MGLRLFKEYYESRYKVSMHPDATLLDIIDVAFCMFGQPNQLIDQNLYNSIPKYYQRHFKEFDFILKRKLDIRWV